MNDTGVWRVRWGRRPARWAWLCAIGIVVLSLLGACGGDDGPDEEASIRAGYEAAAEAWNTRDVEAFLARVSDRWLAEAGDGAGRDEWRAFLPEFIGDPPIAIRSVRVIDLADDHAVVATEQTSGAFLQSSRDELVKLDGQWLLDREERVATPVPVGAQVVPLKLFDFAFGFDAASIRDGNLVFAVENLGAQAHEFGLLRVPEGQTLDELLEFFLNVESPADLPTEIALLGFLTEWEEPGDTYDVVFAEPLAAGRYVLVCFFEDVADPDHTPHAAKGMIAEFRVS